MQRYKPEYDAILAKGIMAISASGEYVLHSEAQAEIERLNAKLEQWKGSSRKMTEFYEHRGRLLEQETAARKEAETSGDERQIMKAALTKIAAQNVEGTGGFVMFRSCVKVAKDALKDAAKAREKS